MKTQLLLKVQIKNINLWLKSSLLKVIEAVVALSLPVWGTRWLRWTYYFQPLSEMLYWLFVKSVWGNRDWHNVVLLPFMDFYPPWQTKLKFSSKSRHGWNIAVDAIVTRKLQPQSCSSLCAVKDLHCTHQNAHEWSLNTDLRTFKSVNVC